jgi:hypothetical protein
MTAVSIDDTSVSGESPRSWLAARSAIEPSNTGAQIAMIDEAGRSASERNRPRGGRHRMMDGDAPLSLQATARYATAQAALAG